MSAAVSVLGIWSGGAIHTINHSASDSIPLRHVSGDRFVSNKKFNDMGISEIYIVKRDGKRKPFSVEKIKRAVRKAFLSVGGYATDVMENELAAGGLTEGAGFDSPLFECDNFIVTPHLGAQTSDAARNIGVHIINRVKDALSLK